MEFSYLHKDFFKAKKGTFSRVTERENYDSQITLTDSETEMVLGFFGEENINIGNVGSNKAKSSKTFFLYPDLRPIQLNLIFPKPEKSELRLYISGRAGFKPKAGEIWFVFINHENKIVIGSLDEKTWNNLGQEDIEDEKYLVEVEDALAKGKIIDINPKGKIIRTIIGSRTVYGRDARIAALRFSISNFTCEVNSEHETFIAQRTNKAYVEAHHFLPIKFQYLFNEPLDSLSNIVSLCPTCHRAIHHSIISHKCSLIKHLYESRADLQNNSLESIIHFYNAIKLPEERF